MSDKGPNLEGTILELGLEIYRLKNELSKLQSSCSDQAKAMHALKSILIDNDLIFDDAIEIKIEEEKIRSWDHELVERFEEAHQRLKKGHH